MRNAVHLRQSASFTQSASKNSSRNFSTSLVAKRNLNVRDYLSSRKGHEVEQVMPEVAKNISKQETSRILGMFKPNVPITGVSSTDDKTKKSKEIKKLEHIGSIAKSGQRVADSIVSHMKQGYDLETQKTPFHFNKYITTNDMERVVPNEDDLDLDERTYSQAFKPDMAKGELPLPARAVFGDMFKTRDEKQEEDGEAWSQAVNKSKLKRVFEPWERIEFEQAVMRKDIKDQLRRAHVNYKQIADDNARSLNYLRSQYGDEMAPQQLESMDAEVADALNQATAAQNELSDLGAIIGGGDRNDNKIHIDPRWEYVEELKKNLHKDEMDLWDHHRIRTIWTELDGARFKNKEEFVSIIKEAGDFNELVRRVQTINPGMSEGAVQSIVERLVRVLKTDRNKMRGASWAINEVSDEITKSSKSEYWRWVDIMSKPRPKMAAVLESIDKILKRRVKERNIMRAFENVLQNDPRDAENPLLSLYESLKPVHSPKDVADIDTNKKIYEPAVHYGSVKAVGRRKTSIANATLTPGTGLFTINGKAYMDYLRNHLVNVVAVSLPLRVCNVMRDFDIEVRVKGGGTTGQTEAIILAISRALAKFQPEFGPLLSVNKLMSRDPRMVERKKPGKPKARKSFQWVKR